MARVRPGVTELVRLYKGLSPTAQRGVLVLLGVEAVLIVVAERDIQRRTARSIRGPKWVWRVIATQNFVGPVAYFGLGRRRGG